MTKRYLFGRWETAEGALTVEDVARICREAETRRAPLADYPRDKILRLLGRVGRAWADPAFPPRVAMTRALPETTGFSPAMIELAMAEVVWTLDPESLEKKVATELRGIPRQGELHWRHEDGTALSWTPLGTVLHVLSGNVFLVGIGSLVEGLLTGNVTLLKMASGETVFLPVFLETLKEMDEDGVVAKSVALLEYSSSQKDVIAELKRRVDGIVVWGGEEAVKAYRDGLPARTKILLFGPKLSIGVATEIGIESAGVEETADRLAKEVSIWDQNACTAPQLCYVQGEKNAVRLAEALAAALAKEAERLPAGPAEVNTAVEIQKLRSIAEIAETRGEMTLHASEGNVDWTVIVDKNARIEPSPLHRTIRLVPYRNPSELYAAAEQIRGYLQTVGLLAGSEERLALAQQWAAAGALRVLELGAMSGGAIDDPHDGAYDLSQLVNVVVTRVPVPSSRRPFDLLPATRRRAVLDERLRRLLDIAARSPFYAKRLEGVTLDGVADLPKLPPLTRAEMEANLPPRADGLTTRPAAGGYVSRSGGSTGEPKFAWYDGPDWDVMVDHAADMFRAVGLAKGDRIANCMLAGDLYGSFVSFDHINSRLGMTSFAFAGKIDPEVFLKVWRNFHINAIQAIPAVLMPLLRESKQREPGFSLEKVVYAGTALQRSDYDWIKQNLGAPRIASIIGANDGCQLAYQCEAMSQAMHHLVDDFNYVEIVDDNGRPVPDGTPGRILITSLLKHSFPLIRYEVGDAGRIVAEDCACGRSDRVLEYLGRSDDGLCVGVINLHFRDVAAALDGLTFSEMQLAARNEGGIDRVVVRLEAEGAPSSLREAAQGRLFERIPRLFDHLKSGTLRSIDVEVLGTGALPRNPRSGKIRQLSDERV